MPVFTHQDSPDQLDGKLTHGSTFKAPATVRVSASRPRSGSGIDLHFVNYDREEPQKRKSAGGGIKDEKPIPVENVSANFALPGGHKAIRIEIISPEWEHEKEVEFEIVEGRVRFNVPKFLVYAVARVK